MFQLISFEQEKRIEQSEYSLIAGELIQVFIESKINAPIQFFEMN